MLQDPRLSHCLDAILAEARQRGVEAFSVNGCCEDDWGKVGMIGRL